MESGKTLKLSEARKSPGKVLEIGFWRKVQTLDNDNNNKIYVKTLKGNIRGYPSS